MASLSMPTASLRPRIAGTERASWHRPPTSTLRDGGDQGSPSGPDLNPQEGIWSLVKRDIGSLAAADLNQVTRAVKRKLKMLQYRPEVIDGCLAGTDLILDM
ncbi:hypothetical protein ACFVZD_47825 [Streptomyces sp. NPDC058287]|uniref:hypothetical protein n=1 Tax=unclassified Streptomyces TaxID=2593676 RepID=UPI0036E99CC6